MSTRWILGSYLVLLHVAAGALIWRPELAAALHRRLADPEAEAGPSRFVAAMRGHHRRLASNIEPGAVLFLGSSSIQGLDAGAVVDRAVNLGVGSDTVAGLRARWPARAVAEARAVVLAIGFNDLSAQPVDAVLARFAELLARIPDTTPVLVSGIQPIDTELVPQRLAGMGAAIRDLNQGYRALCQARPGCWYADTWSALAPARCPARPVHEDDGIHLNARGYTCWKDTLRSGLRALGVDGVRAAASASPRPRAGPAAH